MKELIFRLTVDMGQAGNSPDRDQSGKKSRNLGYASSQLSHVRFSVLKVHAFCMDKGKWRKLAVYSLRRNGKRKGKKHFRWSDEMHSSLIECLTNYKVSCEFTNTD